MNKRNSNGDKALPCATPVSNLIVAHVLSLGATLTVECSYNAFEQVYIWDVVRFHYFLQRCLVHRIERIFKINIHSVYSLHQSLSLCRDTLHLAHVDAHASALPTASLSWS